MKSLAVSILVVMLCVSTSASGQQPAPSAEDRTAPPPTAPSQDQPVDDSSSVTAPVAGADSAPDGQPDAAEPPGAGVEPAAATAAGQATDGPPAPTSIADPPPSSPPEPQARKNAQKKKKKKKKKKKQKKRKKITVKGRVFVRNTIGRAADGEPGADAGWLNDLEVDSARMSVRYRDRRRKLRVEVEAELAGNKAEVRDAYIRWQPRSYVRVQLGRFRPPIGSVSQTSRWFLPIIERGLLNDLRVTNELTDEADRIPVGSRNIGVQVQWRGDYWGRPKATLAVFRSAVHEQLEGRDPVGWSSGFPEDIYGRVSLEPIPDVHIGATVVWLGLLGTAADADTFRHGLVGSLDATIETGPLRLWLETFMGTNPTHLRSTLEAEGRYVAHRAVISVRLDMESGPLAYLEPYASAQYLDLSDVIPDDTGREFGLGSVVGLTKSWRLQVGYETRTVGTWLSGSGSRFIVQAGALF